MTVIYPYPKNPKTCRRQPFYCWLFGVIFMVVSASVMAQEPSSDSTPPVVDTTAPVIELEALEEGVADSSQVFTVQIAEESELESATLHYRRLGEQPYSEAPMSPLGDSGFYTVSIPTDPGDLNAIEYYIEARDSAGNRTVSGFAFAPLSRTLLPAAVSQSSQPIIEQPVIEQSALEQPIVEEPNPVETSPAITEATPFYKKRWFHVTLGVIAVGVLASSMDSGGEDSQVVPVNFVFEQ